MYQINPSWLWYNLYICTCMYSQHTVAIHNALIAAYSIGKNTSSATWITSLHLLMEHKNILQRRLWLDDAIIKAGQKLLRRQFPDVGGLESTLTVAAKSCKTLPGGAIQVMHILSNHWICIKLNEDKTTVFLYDSKYSSIPHTVVDLIINIIHSEKDTVTIKNMAMQEQQGCDACGVFSLAVATALCNDQDPSMLRWKQDAMWQHLLKSLEEETLSPFPVDSKSTSSPEKDVTKATALHNLYCICRIRYKQKDRMKQCSGCNEWFHAACLNIPAKVLVKGEVWTCSSCI